MTLFPSMPTCLCGCVLQWMLLCCSQRFGFPNERPSPSPLGPPLSASAAAAQSLLVLLYLDPAEFFERAQTQRGSMTLHQ